MTSKTFSHSNFLWLILIASILKLQMELKLLKDFLHQINKLEK